MEHLILPPKVRGEICAYLQVGCDFIKFNNKNVCGPIGVYLLWWGQDTTQQVCLSPPILHAKELPSDRTCNDNYKGIRSTVYHIVTEEDQFQNYLTDSRYLFLQIRDSGDNAIGFSAVERLSRLLKFGGLSDDLPIYSCTENANDISQPRDIGRVRIWMTYDISNGNESIVPDNSSVARTNMKMSSTAKLNDYNPPEPKMNASSQKPSEYQMTKKLGKSNRSSPVLLVSKKKTPLRNSNLYNKNYSSNFRL